MPGPFAGEHLLRVSGDVPLATASEGDEREPATRAVDCAETLREGTPCDR
jgi:hypothetical protein